ncbi:MAG: hypothetical protein ACFFAO_15630 [Candidatus Hermodarchaeota archaeon]
MKYKEEMILLTKKLKKDGFKKVIDPSNDIYVQEINLIEKAKNHKIYESLIKDADLLIVFDKEGYVGTSSAMEIQKALDSNVPVRFLFEPQAVEFKALCLHPEYNIKVDKHYLK